MIKLLKLSLLLSALFFIIPANATSPIPSDFNRLKQFFAKHMQHKKTVRLLFIQQAKQGVLTKASQKPGCYQLTLQQLKPEVLYFSDEPKRMTGRLSNSHFVKTIKYNARQYHIKPNVAIQAYVVDHNQVKEINEVAAISNPQYNAAAQTVSYTACPLPKTNFQVAHLKMINLFFDPFNPWPP